MNTKYPSIFFIRNFRKISLSSSVLSKLLYICHSFYKYFCIKYLIICIFPPNPLRISKSLNIFCTSIVRTMSRKKITLRLSEDVIQNAKAANMNISYFLEVKIIEHLAMRNTPRERFELSLPGWRTGSQGRRVRPDFATSAI